MAENLNELWKSLEVLSDLEVLHESILFEEMTNTSKKNTGLPYDLQVGGLGVDRHASHHEPRLKAAVDHQYIPVTISEDPQIPSGVGSYLGREPFKDFSKVRAYIAAYRRILVALQTRTIFVVEGGGLSDC